MSPTSGIDVAALLAPVPGPSPAGVDLRYERAYDDIKAARRLAESRRDPSRDGEEVSASDAVLWKKVAELSAAALAKSKDLQIAIWLLEALAQFDAYRGVSTGLNVIQGLVAGFWEPLHPQPDTEEDDPLGFRTSLLSWLNEKLPPIVKAAPLTAPPAAYGVLHYEVTLRTGDEKRALLEDGQWPSSERFEQALQASPVPHLEELLEQIASCEASLGAIQAVVEQRYADAVGSETPSFGHLRETFVTGRHLVERPLKKKRGVQAPAGAPAGAEAPTSISQSPLPEGGSPNDQVWDHALTLTRDSRLDGLRLLQEQVALAGGGRDRFLKELQLAELCLEARVHALAYPIFDSLARTIDTRHLDEWEDRTLILRVWKGLVRCCGLLESQVAEAGPRGREIESRVATFTQAPTQTSTS